MIETKNHFLTQIRRSSWQLLYFLNVVVAPALILLFFITGLDKVMDEAKTFFVDINVDFAKKNESSDEGGCVVKASENLRSVLPPSKCKQASIDQSQLSN